MKAILWGLFLTAISANATTIDEIRFDGEGLTSDQIQTMKSMSELLPGEDYDQQRSGVTLEKLKVYLKAKGYEQVKVSESFEKNKESR